MQIKLIPAWSLVLLISIFESISHKAPLSRSVSIRSIEITKTDYGH